MTAHGTPLVGGGSPDVLIGGRPAWRASVDYHQCPLVDGVRPHGGGAVVTGSPSVFVNGLPAARQGDAIAENGPPNVIATGDPTVLIGGGSTAIGPSWAESLFEQLVGVVPDANEAIAQADLGIAGDQLARERANLHVTHDGAEAVFSFRTDADGRIREFAWGPRDDARLRIETDRATLDRLAAADDPVDAGWRAVRDGDVEIAGIGRFQAVKWTLFNGLRAVARFVDRG